MSMGASLANSLQDVYMDTLKKDLPWSFAKVSSLAMSLKQARVEAGKMVETESDGVVQWRM